MLQTKTINDNCVAVSYDPERIYLRQHGKVNYDKEKLVIDVNANKIIINKSIANEFGLEIEII